VKRDLTQPVIYAVLLSLLLGIRLLWINRKNRNGRSGD
jgi:DMSO/TMAO reductase YedYZ heme-binding membrane subunit